MPDHAIQIHGLRKTYRRRGKASVIALDGLSLDVPTGSVFGFLGPNGSGKTTTIRCMLGLARPTAGRCRVLGAESPADLQRVISRVGAVVEAPTFYGRFSGRRYLQILARAGGVDRGRVDPMLARVGLADRGGDAIRAYSLGMRQRLALAAVLLKDPQLLVLDEPGNGLDPAGIKQLRDLLRSLAAEGRTVFVSSHLLAEIQLMCDTVGIVSQGRCIASGPVDEIVSSGGRAGTLVRASDLRRAGRALERSGISVTIGTDHIVAASLDGSEVNRVLVAAGVYASEIRPEEITLESVFLELTGGEAG